MDIELIRQQTEGCHHILFMNSAGSSLVPDIVTEKMITYLQEEAMIGGYALAAKYESEINGVYTEAAKLLNCQPDNIAFMGSATDAFAKAMSSINFNDGDVILTTDDDYISNQLCFLSLKSRYGVEVLRADNLPNGDLDLVSFEKLVIKYEPKLVAITHIPTNSGLVHPAEEVGVICKKYEILYLLDACQSVGQLHIDVQKIGCDFLTATGRKFLRGPRGTGLLYVSDNALHMGMVPLIFDMQGADWTAADEYQLRKTARRFEFWESSAASKLGLATALHYLNDIGIQQVEEYNSNLSAELRRKLQALDGLQLHDRGSRLSNIITFTTQRRSLEETANLLKQHHVQFSMSFRDFALIDFNKKDLDGVIRLSPHYFNTHQELEKITDILRN